MYESTLSPPGTVGSNAEERQVLVELRLLQDRVPVLFQALTELEARLSPVLRPSVPTPGNGASTKARDAMVPLAENISNPRVQIELAIATIGGIQSRLEI